MKIALLTDSDVFAGTERHMLDLGLELRGLGVQPALVCPANGALAKRGRAAGLPVVGIEKRGRIDVRAIRRLAQALASGEFDVIHAHNGRTALLAPVARRFARRGSLVATQHFLEPARAVRRGLAGRAGRAIHHWADHRIDFHVAISRAVGDALLARGETSPAKLRVVLNGIRDPLGSALAPREAIRARFGVPPGSQLIVCLARLEPEKGVDVLMEAMSMVAGTRPAACCLVAGGGSLEGMLRARLAGLRPAPNMGLLGFVEDSLSLVNAADLFVLPSRAEPFGLSLVEAMALGKPVIATRAGGPVEIVRDGQTGRLVAPDRPDALAEAIAALLANADGATAMGQAARADYLVRFTAQRMAEEMLAVYREAVGS